MGRYRVLFRAQSHLRLVERPDDAPFRWLLPINQGSGSETLTEVVDVIEEQSGVPVHLGLEVQVELDAASIDEAVEAARAQAETTLIFLASSARAPVGPATEFLAYEVTRGVEERALIQWFSDIPITLGHAVVPQELFGQLFERVFTSQDERLQWRLGLSFSWYRAALDEADALTRFLHLWIGFEAVGPLLADLYAVKAAGFGGIRALTEEHGVGDDVISQALGLRRDLFHARRVFPRDLRARADVLVPKIEELLLAAWARLLELDLNKLKMPERSVAPWPVRLIVRAVLHQADASQWAPGHHPHFEGVISQRRAPSEPGKLSIEYPHRLELVNAARAGSVEVELWGPDLPNTPTATVRFDGVTRAEPAANTD